jgi:hypothetical protein
MVCQISSSPGVEVRTRLEDGLKHADRVLFLSNCELIFEAHLPLLVGVSEHTTHNHVGEAFSVLS